MKMIGGYSKLPTGKALTPDQSAAKYVYTCQRCSVVFGHRRKRSRPPKYCGQDCANNRPSKVNVTTLERLALQGCRNGYMAQELGVNAATVRRALIDSGLFNVWAKARYAKCRAQAAVPA